MAAMILSFAFVMAMVVGLWGCGTGSGTSQLTQTSSTQPTASGSDYFVTTSTTLTGVSTSDNVPTPTTAIAYLPPTMPENFAFTAAYGVRANNIINTFDGTFTKDVIDPPQPNPMTALRLTPEEMASLYHDLVDIGILDYPSDFRPDAEQEAKSGIHHWVDPHNTYWLRVRAAACDKYVLWEDISGSVALKAKALRAWFNKLEQMIEVKPEYKAMPPIQGGYA
jgi:hypothetical protein